MKILRFLLAAILVLSLCAPLGAVAGEQGSISVSVSLLKGKTAYVKISGPGLEKEWLNMMSGSEVQCTLPNMEAGQTKSYKVYIRMSDRWDNLYTYDIKCCPFQIVNRQVGWSPGPAYQVTDEMQGSRLRVWVLDMADPGPDWSES